MSEGQKKPGVAFWATVAVVVVLVGYPLSIGPAYWVWSNVFGESPASSAVLEYLYWPIIVACDSHAVHRAISWWIKFWVPCEIP
jgi:hypothetical protein